jgi:hypothetical protein
VQHANEQANEQTLREMDASASGEVPHDSARAFAFTASFKFP